MARRAFILLGAAFVGLALARSAPAQDAPAGRFHVSDTLPVDPDVTVGRLENGLRYFIRVNRRPEQRAELRLIVNAGSVLEDDDQLGLAHFVEHMAFNGTEHYPKQELVDYLESIGMQFGPDVNAYTSFDETVYMLTVPTDSAAILRQAFQVLEDWAHLQTFDSTEIELERGVVLEEWRLGRGAAARMRDEQFPVLFQGSRYAERLPIGTPEILETFEHEALERFYSDWYRPDLMAVVAVGDFDAETVESLIRQHFGGLRAPDAVRPRRLAEVPDHDEPLFSVATDEEATGTRVTLYFKQPVRSEGTVGDYRRSIVEILYSAMLNRRLFELSQQADAPYLGAGSGQGRIVRSKEVYLLVAGVREDGVTDGLEALLTEAARVAQHGFTASELTRIKVDYLRGMEQVYAERDKTESEAYAAEYTRAFLEGEPFPGIAVEHALTQELVPPVELHEVNRLARQWITDGNRVVLVNGPEKEGLAMPDEVALEAVFTAVAVKEIAPYVDEVADAPLLSERPRGGAVMQEEAIEELDVTVWELANGVRVILKPTDFKDDQILLDSWSPGGTSLAPDADHVAAMTAAWVIQRGGVGEFSLVDLEKVLAGKAVGVSPYISSLYEGLSGSASPQDVETLFQLVYLYFTTPRKDRDAYLAFRQQITEGLRNRAADPEGTFRDTVDVTLWQHHPRRRPATVELYEEMDLDKSVEFYRDRFADASDFTFVLVGNLDPDSLRPLVETYLGGLPSIGRVETWRDVGMRYPSGVIRKTVQRGVEPRSQTVLAFTGTWEYGRRDQYVLRALGSVLEIRLREVLREDLGGTYSVGVSSNGARRPSEQFSVKISFGSDPERVEELVGVVFQQIDSLKALGPTDVEVEKVQEMQRRARETALRENGFWTQMLLNHDRFGTDAREILAYEDLVAALSVDRVREAARRYLRPDNYVLVTLYPEAMN
jgi:zinc protease